MCCICFKSNFCGAISSSLGYICVFPNFALIDLFGLSIIKVQQAPNASKADKRKNAKRDDTKENPKDYSDPETPLGEKKHLSHQMAKEYCPSAVEKS